MAINTNPESAEEMRYYAECLYFGFETEENQEEAFKWYMKAAELGNLPAIFSVGNLYFYGSGVEKNPEEGFKWFMKSAEAGFAVGQYRVAELLYEGRCCEQDKEAAIEWMKKASANGEKLADEWLRSIGC